MRATVMMKANVTVSRSPSVTCHDDAFGDTTRDRSVALHTDGQPFWIRWVTNNSLLSFYVCPPVRFKVHILRQKMLLKASVSSEIIHIGHMDKMMYDVTAGLDVEELLHKLWMRYSCCSLRLPLFRFSSPSLSQVPPLNHSFKLSLKPQGPSISSKLALDC